MDVHLDSIGPLLFVDLDTDPMPLEEQAGTKPELESFPLEEYEHARRYVSAVACNWKTFSGNYSECDHCQANHGDWIRGISIDESELVVDDHYWVLHYTHDEGAEAEEALVDGEARFYYFWPDFTVQMYGNADGYGTYIIDPIDEGRFQLIVDYYSRDTELTDEEREFVKLSRKLQEEDFELVERQHEGMKSGALAQGQLGPNEHTVHRLHRLAQEACDA